jgi:hypothetical protein
MSMENANGTMRVSSSAPVGCLDDFGESTRATELLIASIEQCLRLSSRAQLPGELAE